MESLLGVVDIVLPTNPVPEHLLDQPTVKANQG